MSPFKDDHFAIVRKFRPPIVAVGRKVREASQHVELGESLGRLADTPRLRAHPATNLAEKLAFETLASFLSIQDFRLKLLQLGRGKALGIRNRLLAFVVR